MLLAQDINLPAPVKTGGKPLMQALSERKSIRFYQDKDYIFNFELSGLQILIIQKAGIAITPFGRDRWFPATCANL